MNNFTRNELANELSRRLALPVYKTKTIVDETLEALTEALLAEKSVQFRGFGLFDVVKRKPKIGRNPLKPQAGQYQIPARRMVRFRAGSQLFSQLNPEL